MSGMQGMPMGGPPAMGGGGPPALPPQVLQMLMQRMQQGQGGPPQGMPGGPPPSMQGPMGPPNTPTPGQGAPMAGAPPPIPQPGQQPMTPPQMAAQGRLGDSVIAHLTPGEIEIPPQVQTPQLMEMIRAAFAHVGIDPAQFTAGSPQASHNPTTGAPEFSLWASLLPILGAVGGGIIGGLPTMGIGAPAGAAIGGGLGGAAGGLVDKQTPLGVLLSSAGGAGGGYLGAGGTLGGALGSAAGEAASGAGSAASGAASSAANAAGAAGGFAEGLAPATAGTIGGAIDSGAFTAPTAAASASPFGTGSLSDLMKMAKPGLWASTGAGLGSLLAPTPQVDPLKAAGFNKPLPPLNPNFNQLRGAGTVSTPQFQNYNPYSAVTGGSPGYNFFPGQAG